MTLAYSEFAQIQVIRYDSPLGGEPLFSFGWRGSSHAPIALSYCFVRRFLENPNFPNFPFKMEVIEREPGRGVIVYRRTDIPINLRLIQFLEARWLKHCRAFIGIQMRLILTLHVWGLAYVPDYEIPSWGCVGRKRL